MKRSETGINLQETRNSENETTETKQPKQAKPSKRRKRNDWNLVTRPKKKKAVDDNKNIAIRFVSIVVYSWSNSRENRSLDCHDVVVCFGRYGGFVSVVTVVSFWWFRLFRLFRFGRLVSLFRVLVHAV